MGDEGPPVACKVLLASSKRLPLELPAGVAFCGPSTMAAKAAGSILSAGCGAASCVTAGAELEGKTAADMGEIGLTDSERVGG